MTVRILVVDDYEPWRHRVRSLLQSRPDWQVIGEVSDGPKAIQKAKDLEPDLVLLDITLPTLNGIEAARRIRELSPNSKIVFLTQDNSLDVVQVALSTGAEGYVWKPRAQSDLLPAIDAVLVLEPHSDKPTYQDVATTKAPRCHMSSEPILLADVLPTLPKELQELLEDRGESGLVSQVSSLRIVDRCRCGDFFCASFYTQTKPAGAYGPGHRSVDLDATKGMIVLDVVDGVIAHVEVLNRNDIRQKLLEALP